MHTGVKIDQVVTRSSNLLVMLLSCTCKDEYIYFKINQCIVINLSFMGFLLAVLLKEKKKSIKLVTPTTH